MCQKCLHEAFPKRHRTALDSGAYILNYASCAKCGNGASGQGLSCLNSVGRKVEEDENEEDDEYEETVTYQHCCAQCGHVVAEHYYRFNVSDEMQDYLMECSLCGKGASSHRIDDGTCSNGQSDVVGYMYQSSAAASASVSAPEQQEEVNAGVLPTSEGERRSGANMILMGSLGQSTAFAAAMALQHEDDQDDWDDDE